MVGQVAIDTYLADLAALEMTCEPPTPLNFIEAHWIADNEAAKASMADDMFWIGSWIFINEVNYV